MQYKYIEHQDEDLELEGFLERNGLCLQKEYEWGYKVYEEQKLVACGFVRNHLLMMIAIDEEYRHQGLLQNLMSKLLETSIQKQIDPIYLFTRKEHEKTFKSCGLFTIIKDDVVLMSNDLEMLNNQKIREYLINEKWPYSYYFCKDKKEYEEYKKKIQEKIKVWK